MRKGQKIGTALTCVLLLAGQVAVAEPGHEEGQNHGPAENHGPAQNHEPAQGHGAPRGEPHQGPSGYQRVAPPKGWDARPAQADRSAYQHNFRAARSFHVGPYHRPAGWTAHTWAYGQILPRPYWASQYILADYWLFALEVPPAGYEWVRDGSDALLISTDSGEILQVEYGVFA
jgi:Ni/Co efflux regulator RcnB